MLKLYYYPNNANLAPHFLLHHIGAQYELMLVDRKKNVHKSKEYLTLNPAGRIPTLVDGVEVFFESTAICIYLNELYPVFSLIPPIGSKKRLHFFQWMSFLTNTMQAELMVRHYPLKHTVSPDNVEDIINAQDERIAETLAIVDGQLKDKEYLLGENLTACDYFLFMHFLWCLPIKTTLWLFDNLTKYLKNMAEQPTIKKVCEIEGISLTSFLHLGK